MVIVTGGAGFIGTNLVRSLLELDKKVLVVEDVITTGKSSMECAKIIKKSKNFKPNPGKSEKGFFDRVRDFMS